MELTLIFALISIFSSYFLPSVASEPLIKPVGPCTNSTHFSKKVQDLAESSGKALKGSIKLESLQKSQVVLRGNATITSANKTFRLGFFAPNDEFKWYLGIWYASIPIPTYVWVANREKPIKNLMSASAEITEDGKLAVIDQDSRTLMWETSNVEKASDLRLLEQGNLVLLSSDGRIVWRSFDFPTDTWLPA
ncbi:UNVERIFIED_CONTAM: Receptor-like serine/threonine-protein kinase SD1-7 [Sesamum radiatum]|uniref:Receptor-like serine/threonine-protein kinase SD1-7 n=1 Tax=Sesamum radiatum TaxID=300843 RepID=A0AAW2VA91_SESRA